MKGYQPVEPTGLQVISAEGLFGAFTITILHWLCVMLRVEYKNYLDRVEFDVICVSYFGSYPAIGIHYKDPACEDIGSNVEASINRLLSEMPIIDFINYIVTNKADWSTIASKLMT